MSWDVMGLSKQGATKGSMDFLFKKMGFSHSETIAIYVPRVRGLTVCYPSPPGGKQLFLHFFFGNV